MHILIAFLTALATLLFALERLGIDIGWVNPWAWSRRRRWIKQLHVNPAFNLDSPMEAAALLTLATARIEGDLSSEEKGELRHIFMETFSQTEEEVSALLVSSTYLLGSGEEVIDRPEEVLNRSLEKFTDDQKVTTIEILNRIANTGSPPSSTQNQYIRKVSAALRSNTDSENWS